MSMQFDLIELADETLAANRRVRAHSDHLRAQTIALLFTYRLHRFPQVFGASDACEEDRVRRLLRDFCAVIEPPKSYAGLSRGSVCQACGNTIKSGEPNTTSQRARPRCGSMATAIKFSSRNRFRARNRHSSRSRSTPSTTTPPIA